MKSRAERRREWRMAEKNKDYGHILQEASSLAERWENLPEPEDPLLAKLQGLLQKYAALYADEHVQNTINVKWDKQP